jgi:hypothetical protein
VQSVRPSYIFTISSSIHLDLALRILLVCFVGTARSSGVVRVNGRTVIVLPLPVAWSLALDQDILEDFMREENQEIRNIKRAQQV